MKLDRTNYLELIVHHKDSSLHEYPSRFCVLRVCYSQAPDSVIPGVFSFSLSVGQIRKLISIGFFSDPDSYLAYGHRPFDKDLIKYPISFHQIFRDRVLSFRVKYASLFK